MTNNGINYDLNAVRLQRAVLCVDCDVISDSPHADCLVCGSRSLLPLARVLNPTDRSSIQAVPKQQEDGRENARPVLVLVPSLPHRSRKRAHP